VSSIELSFDEGVAMATVGIALGGRSRRTRPQDPVPQIQVPQIRVPQIRVLQGRLRRDQVREGRAPRGGVRLTRRGRLVLLALLLALAGLVGVLVAASTGEAAAPARPAPTVVVQPGDTLWSIAARYAPGPDPFGTIEQIRQLNGLDGYTVHAGETLVLPPRRG
jgi:LysM domain